MNGDRITDFEKSLVKKCHDKGEALALVLGMRRYGLEYEFKEIIEHNPDVGVESHLDIVAENAPGIELDDEEL